MLAVLDDGHLSFDGERRRLEWIRRRSLPSIWVRLHSSPAVSADSGRGQNVLGTKGSSELSYREVLEDNLSCRPDAGTRSTSALTG